MAGKVGNFSSWLSDSSGVYRGGGFLHAAAVSESAAYLKSRAAMVERALRDCLPSAATKPATLHGAMRYCLLGGGKRLRPILCLAAAEACGGNARAALPSACAIECVHTYSLVHDDLPCMDDDDLRRGRPTAHKVYGEGIAVLAGDALLTLAFELLADMPPRQRHGPGDFTRELALAAGSRALVAGQVADLEAEQNPAARTLREIRFIHRGKTAAMIACSLVLGGMAANATPARIKILRESGVQLGLAFQIVDDILDVTRSTEELGKSAGKDTKAGKATYPAAIGIEASRKAAAQATRAAITRLGKLPGGGGMLPHLAKRMLSRGR